jgi:hypothetical protein
MIQVPVLSPGLFYFYCVLRISNKIDTMKFLTLLAVIVISSGLAAQKRTFPQTWAGDWTGEVNWYKTGEAIPSKVSMQLNIHPTFNADTWTWQIIYGGDTADNRPYKLIAKDSTGVHWVIDENNGIVLDQYWVAGRLCGAFTVGSATIINNYWIEGDNLVVEFYSIASKPISTTGGTATVPGVDSYQIAGYQKALLKRRY